MPWREALRPVGMQRVAVAGPGPGPARRAGRGGGHRHRRARRTPGPRGADGARLRGRPAPATARRRGRPRALAAPPGPRRVRGAWPARPARRVRPSSTPRAAQAVDRGTRGRPGRVDPASRPSARSPTSLAAVAAPPPCPLPGPARRPAADAAAPERVPPTFAPLVRHLRDRALRRRRPARCSPGLAYVVMFGMMFADVGHGRPAARGGAALRRSAPRRAGAACGAVWPFLAGAGGGEHGLRPALRRVLRPDRRAPGAVAGAAGAPGAAARRGRGASGAVLLAGAYALGTVNRFREGGWRSRRLRPVRARGRRASSWVSAAAARPGSTSERWVARHRRRPGRRGRPGPRRSSGCWPAPGGGGGGRAQAAVELVDLVVRLGSNVVSLRPPGGVRADARRARARGLGGHHRPVAARGRRPRRRGRRLRGRQRPRPSRSRRWSPAIQALRLEYYELFSRVFDLEGRPVPALARAVRGPPPRTSGGPGRRSTRPCAVHPAARPAGGVADTLLPALVAGRRRDCCSWPSSCCWSWPRRRAVARRPTRRRPAAADGAPPRLVGRPAPTARR